VAASGAQEEKAAPRYRWLVCTSSEAQEVGVEERKKPLEVKNQAFIKKEKGQIKLKYPRHCR